MRKNYTSSVCDLNDHFKCDNGQCIQRHQVCDGQSDCDDESDESSDGQSKCTTKDICTFETGRCGLKMTNDFVLTKGSQGSQIEQQPTRDHSTNSKNGQFLLLKRRGRKSTFNIEDTTPLTSPCITFYVMTMAKNPTISVNGRKVGLDMNDFGRWQKIYVDGLTVGSGLKFAISLVSSSRTEYIAIDDIARNRICATEPAKPATVLPLVTETLTEKPELERPITVAPPKPVFSKVPFNCWASGSMIPKYLICDGVQDCFHGEDENQRICRKIINGVTRDNRN